MLYLGAQSAADKILWESPHTGRMTHWIYGGRVEAVAVVRLGVTRCEWEWGLGVGMNMRSITITQHMGKRSSTITQDMEKRSITRKGFNHHMLGGTSWSSGW